MDLNLALLLGLVQWITEFLPVSSSGHLALFEVFLWEKDFLEKMLSFDAILHWWSLLALFIYFWKDIYQVSSWFHKKWSDEQKLFFILIIATIPAVLSGILLSDFLEKYSHSLLFLWITFLISSIYFFISEFFSEKIAKKEEKISIKNWFLIWISQAISIIPWISRSWTTLSTWILLWMVCKR